MSISCVSVRAYVFVVCICFVLCDCMIYISRSVELAIRMHEEACDMHMSCIISDMHHCMSSLIEL